MPYFKSKLYSIYNKEREARLQASLWGHDDERFDDTEYIQGEDSLVSSGNLEAEASIRTRLTKRIQKIVGTCYPWLHASSEGMCMFQFSCGFLFAKKCFFFFWILILPLDYMFLKYNYKIITKLYGFLLRYLWISIKGKPLMSFD